MLAAIELCSFPLLGAGTQTIGGYNILTVEGCLFGVMTFGIVLTLTVVGEHWRPAWWSVQCRGSCVGYHGKGSRGGAQIEDIVG